MRFAGVLAREAVTMSFSRRIGLAPSITSQDRWLQLVMTDSPIRMRSLGLSSTLSAMTCLLTIQAEKAFAGCKRLPEQSIVPSRDGDVETPAGARYWNR